MKKFLLSTLCASALLAAATVVPAAAQDQGTQSNTAYGGASGEFLLLGASARGLALGGAYAALATDVSSMYYNPAGLAQMTRPEGMLSTFNYVDSTNYVWGGIALPLAGGARVVGFSLGSFGFSNQPIYTLEAPEGDGRSYSVRETFIQVTGAQNFSDRFSAGISVKLINDRLGSARATAFALDFGTSFHAMAGSRPIRASFVIQNLGSNLRHDGADLDAGTQRTPPLGVITVPQEPQPARLRTSGWTLPVLFRVGLAVDVFSQGMNRVTVLGQFDQPNNNKPAAGGGLEYALSNVGNSGFSLALRGSYTMSPDNQVNDINFNGVPTAEKSGTFTSDGLAVGGGLSYARGHARLGFDYGYRNMGALGGTNFLSFTVGW